MSVLQVDADAQEVGGAGGLAALAADAVLHARGRGHLLRSVDGGWDHLKDVCGARTNAKRAADAGVVDLHGMGAASHKLGALLASAHCACSCSDGNACCGHASHCAEGPRCIGAGTQTRTMDRLLHRLHLEACGGKGCWAETSNQRHSAGCQAKGQLRHGSSMPTAEKPYKNSCRTAVRRKAARCT